VADYAYPLQTTVGVAWGPAVEVGGGCGTCPHFAPCKQSVDGGDFALCEAVAPWDVDPGDEGQVERWDYCDRLGPGEAVVMEGGVSMAEAGRALGLKRQTVQVWVRREKVRSVQGKRRGAGFERLVDLDEVARYARARGML